MMQKESKQCYLAAMGIDVWRIRNASTSLAPEDYLHCYHLYNQNNNCVGILWLEVSAGYAQDNTTQALLLAMFAAINLKLQRVEQYQHIPPASKVAVVMALTKDTALMQIAGNALATQQQKLLVQKIYHPQILVNEPNKKREAWTHLKQIQVMLS